MAQMTWPALFHLSDLFTKQTNGVIALDQTICEAEIEAWARTVCEASLSNPSPPLAPWQELPSELGLDRFVCAAPIKRLAVTRHRSRVCRPTVRMSNVGVSRATSRMVPRCI